MLEGRSRMQVIGICRLSYPAEGGFQRLHECLEERCAYLYEDERLNKRFATLETVTLPSIRSQTDKDFSFFVFIGSSLPQASKDRIYAAVRDIPQVQIIEREPGPYRTEMQSIFDEVRNPDAEICAQFRLDDDDAVGVDFVKDLRIAARRSQSILNYSGKIAIDFSSGFAATFTDRGVKLALIQKRLWTPALAILLLPRCKRSILNYGHHRLAEDMPVVTIPNQNMFIRSFHGDNDSLAFRVGATYDYQEIDDFTARYVKKTFNLDYEDVNEAWKLAL